MKSLQKNDLVMSELTFNNSNTNELGDGHGKGLAKEVQDY